MRPMYVVVLCLAIGSVLVAQSPTLRQRVAIKNGNVEVHVNSDSQPATLAQVVADTDVVVRGRVGAGVARLSPDEYDILTTYELINSTVSFSAKQPPASRPGVIPRAITITLHGGTVPIGAFTATMTYSDLPQLKRGMEVVALLKDHDGKYLPAGGAGMFEVREGGVVAMSSDLTEREKLNGTPVENFLNQVLTMRKNQARR